LFESSSPLLKVVEYCRNLERFSFGDEGDTLELKSSDIEAFSTLPHLKILWIGNCSVADNAFSLLSRCKVLEHLRIAAFYLNYSSILASIGRNLISLELWETSSDVVVGIVENCPNLEYLELKEVEIDKEVNEGLVGSTKNGLMKLAKFKVNKESIHLGTDWEGYY
jgi:hypothetical protein